MKALTIELDLAQLKQMMPTVLREIANDLEQEASASPGIEPAALPRLGTDLPFNGGRFVGIIRGADRDRAVFVCTDAAGDFEGKWMPEYSEIDAKDDHDGRANTTAMADAGSEIAKKALALEVGKHKDWYIPSRQELALCFMHARDLFDNERAYWSSTQYSSDYAWGQYFSYGTVTVWGKANELRVRAVRTIPL